MKSHGLIRNNTAGFSLIAENSFFCCRSVLQQMAEKQQQHFSTCKTSKRREVVRYQKMYKTASVTSWAVNMFTKLNLSRAKAVKHAVEQLCFVSLVPVCMTGRRLSLRPSVLRRRRSPGRTFVRSIMFNITWLQAVLTPKRHAEKQKLRVTRTHTCSFHYERCLLSQYDVTGVWMGPVHPHLPELTVQPG